MYKKVADAQYRSKLSNELMMYHMKVGLRYKIFFDLTSNLRYSIFIVSHASQSQISNIL